MIDSFIKNPNTNNRSYYFRFIFKNKIYYKPGITSQTLKDRYGSEYKKTYKILYNGKIDSAIRIARELKNKCENGIFLLKYLNDGRHTEIFNKDIIINSDIR